MRSLGAAIGLVTLSLGALLATGINILAMPWVTNNLDDGHLERLFALVGVLAAVNAFGFGGAARRHPLLPPTSDEMAGAQEDAPLRQIKAGDLGVIACTTAAASAGGDGGRRKTAATRRAVEPGQVETRPLVGAHAFAADDVDDSDGNLDGNLIAAVAAMEP